MAIVRTDVPMTFKLCEETIMKLVSAYPFCRTEMLTETAFGRNIRTLVIGRGPRKVIYSAAHHANEWITTPVLLKFVEEFAQAIQSGGKIFGVDAKELVGEEALATLNLPELGIEPTHYEAIRKVCEALKAQGLPVQCITE